MTSPPGQQTALPAARLDADEALALLAALGYRTVLSAAVVAEAANYPGGVPLPGGHVVHQARGTGTYTVCAQAGTPDLLAVTCYGDSIETIRAIALARARKLYGEAAPLSVEAIGTVHATLIGARAGREFYAEVRVRCLDLPEGFRP
jgi:hypothetical protein